jgi:hypothetical protein
MKYQKKPVVVDAIQWTGRNLKEILGFMEPARPQPIAHNQISLNGLIAIRTGDITAHAHTGEWIVKDAAGNFDVVSSEYFRKTYEAVK